jgi:hypothetical protein
MVVWGDVLTHEFELRSDVHHVTEIRLSSGYMFCDSDFNHGAGVLK